MTGYGSPPPANPIAEKNVAETFAESGVTLSHSSTAVASNSLVLDGDGRINNTTLVDDLEDGDKTTANADWGSWDTEFTIQGTTTISGSYTAEIYSSNGNVFDAQLPRSSNAAVSVKLDMMADNQGSNTSDEFSVNVHGPNGRIAGVWFKDGGAVILQTFSQTQILSSWSANTVYSVEIVLDYETETAYGTVDGTTVSDSFENSNTEMSHLVCQNDTNNTGITRNAYYDNVYEGYYAPNSGQTFVEWSQPNDVYRWDAATFQRTLDSETVQVDIQEDDGTGWTTIATDISRGQEITADPTSQVRYKVSLSRSNSNNNPTLDAIARRWVI